MNNITLKLTIEELKLLTTLASDQLFRKEFIDPKMPGHRSRPEEISLGKELVARMRSTAQESSSQEATFPKKIGSRLNKPSAAAR